MRAEEKGKKKLPYAYVINGKRYETRDPTLSAEQMLSNADFDPADEHMLIELLHRETRAKPLDEPIELDGPAVRQFQADRSDRVFRFMLDGDPYDWALPKITEPTIRSLGSVTDEKVIVQDGEDGDRDLANGDAVDLNPQGTEHLRTVTRYIEVFLDGDPKRLERGRYSMEQLFAQLGVEPGYVLNYVNDEGQLVPVSSTGTLRVRNGMKFFSHVPSGGSS